MDYDNLEQLQQSEEDNQRTLSARISNAVFDEMWRYLPDFFDTEVSEIFVRRIQERIETQIRAFVNGTALPRQKGAKKAPPTGWAKLPQEVN